MASVSFKSAAPEAATKPASDVVEVESTVVPAGDNHPQAITPAQPKPSALALSGGAEGLEGEFTPRDITLPRINLVQRTGPMADSGLAPGSIVFNKEVTLSDGKTPIELTVLRLVKQYRQKLEYGNPEMPLVFATQDEVIANGGSLKYGEPNFFQEVAHLFLALAKPDGLPEEQEAHFFREHGDKSYTLAVFTVASTAFTAVGKKVITAGYNQLRDGLWLGKWQLTSELQKNTKGSWYVPQAKFAGMHSKEDAEFFRSLLTGTR